jgi:Ankyrin repeats (3 copies)
VSAGGDVNAKDRKGGQTPLYLAAAANQWECVKYLVEHGADSSIPCQVSWFFWRHHVRMRESSIEITCQKAGQTTLYLAAAVKQWGCAK